MTGGKKYKILAILWLCGCCFAGLRYKFNNFNAGEISPLIEARTDLGKYFMGCKTYENFFVSPYGVAIRRPGTYYISEVKDSNDVTRLIPFEFSTVQAYMPEFGDEYIRFCKDSGQIQDGNSPYEIVSPYSPEELFGLQYIQSADVMYIACPNHPVQKLGRTSHTNWTIEDVNFVNGPFLDENSDEDIHVTASGTTGNITITADANIFTPNNVGGLFEIIHVAETNEYTHTFTSADTSANYTVEIGREFVWTTNGTWAGTVILEKSTDGGVSWLTVSSATYKSNDNIKLSDKEDDGGLYRFNMKTFTSGSCENSLLLWAMDAKGICRITAYNSPNDVNATVISVIDSNEATSRWAEGAWSKRRGYPRALTFFQERLVLAGSEYEPQKLWLSKTGDWPDFLTDTTDDSAVTIEIASNKVNVIQWIYGSDKIFAGTSGGEWSIGPSGDNYVITPTNPPKTRQQSTYGSRPIQGLLLNDAIIYTQRQGKKVRELAYNYEKEGYVSGDLTVLSEHITGNGIVEMEYQQQPDSILWCVRGDGQLAGMTYEKEQEVFGWHRQVTDGNVLSVAVITSSGEDEVWLIVERTIDGINKKYIEQMQPRNFGGEVEDCFFVDCGLTFDGGPSKTITGITKATPGVVSCTGHGFNDGDQVKIADACGMVEINNKIFTVSNPDANSFELRDAADSIDWVTSGYTAYTSGGNVKKVEKDFDELGHLEGKNVVSLGDGAVDANGVVTNGEFSLNNYYNKVHIGLPYTSKLKTQELHIETQMGSSQGRTKRISKVTLRLNESGSGIYIGPDADNLRLVPLRKTTDPMTRAVPLFTGLSEQVYFPAAYSVASEVYLEQSNPLPLKLLAITAEFEVH